VELYLHSATYFIVWCLVKKDNSLQTTVAQSNMTSWGMPSDDSQTISNVTLTTLLAYP
jgi:hypothetical protein